MIMTMMMVRRKVKSNSDRIEDQQGKRKEMKAEKRMYHLIVLLRNLLTIKASLSRTNKNLKPQL